MSIATERVIVKVIAAVATILTIAVSFAGFSLASRGVISWWAYVFVLAWGLAMGTSGFSSGWDARADK